MKKRSLTDPKANLQPAKDSKQDQLSDDIESPEVHKMLYAYKSDNNKQVAQEGRRGNIN